MYPTFLIIVTLLLGHAHSTGRFDEEMLIKDLGSGFLALHFNFVSKEPDYIDSGRNYDLIPKTMLDLLSKYHVQELHLSMTRGFWDDERWGRNFVSSSPVGAEVWAWFEDHATNPDRAWFELTHSLSGHFCASLGQVATPTFSVSPTWSYRPSGLTSNSSEQHRMRYAQLPGEGLCSENLTPWIKMLPCKGLKGISTLLLPTSLFRSNHMALGIDLRRICWDSQCTTIGVEFKQTLTVVFDRRLLYGTPDSSWAIQGLLGSSLRGNCEPAQLSRLFLLTSPTIMKCKLEPSSDYMTTDRRVQLVTNAAQLHGERIVFSPTANSPLSTTKHSPPLISVDKYITRSGLIDAGVRSVLTSRAYFDIQVVHMDLFPWYTQVLFSTLEVYTQRNSTDQFHFTAPVRWNLLPSLARKRMGMLELVLNIPAGQQLTVSYKFRRILQHWDEYPPDANHGYFLPAAVVSYQIPKVKLNEVRSKTATVDRELWLPNWASTYSEYFNQSDNETIDRPGEGFVRIHSSVLLVPMPMPDFSMPFNALCIVCSVVALLFGPIHKITAGQLIAVFPEQSGPPLVKLIRKVLAILKRIRDRVKVGFSKPTVATIYVNNNKKKED